MEITPNRALTRALLVTFGLLATLLPSVVTSAPKEPEAKPLEVIYYFLPG